MSESPPNETVKVMHRRWVGSLLSLLIPGAGLYLAGERKSGLLWFLGLTALAFGKTILVPAEFLPGLYALAALSLVTLSLIILLLVRSFRHVPRLGFAGWSCVVILWLAIGFANAAISRQFIRPFRIPAASMSPTLSSGDDVFVRSSAYWFDSPKRGDIVVFRTDGLNFPGIPKGMLYVKRVAGLPGETLQFENRKLLINGRPIDAPEILAGNRFVIGLDVFLGGGTNGIAISNDCYFVIGDNATNSLDSRYFGPVSRSSIIGKATKIYWPLNRMGDVR